MHFSAVAFILLLSLLFSHGTATATDKGNSIISLGTGIVTYDEFKGVTASSYMDVPFVYTSAVFASYRYFLSKHLAIGIAAGMDEVKGNLTKGNPRITGLTEGTVGTYIRHAYTIAPELFLKYEETGNAMFYGYVGVGYTYSKVEKAYDQRIYAMAYQNGVNTNPTNLPYYLSAKNPLYINENHFNFQVTPIGIRVGNKIAWNIELGLGYKGLINTGLSVKL